MRPASILLALPPAAFPNRKGGGLLTATSGRRTRPNYIAGVFASVLLVPIAFLRHDAGGGAARPEFDLSEPPAPVATWLDQARVVPEHAALPFSLPTTSSPTTSSPAAQVAAPAVRPSTIAAPTTAPPTTSPAVTTTTAAPAATTPARLGPAAAPTTTRAPTTTVAPTTAALAPRPFGTQSARGVASWFNAPDGTCAHTTIPKGTVIRITRLHNGAHTTCVVNDWGPADTSRIIDLSMDTFAKLAAPEAGLIDVLIEW